MIGLGLSLPEVALRRTPAVEEGGVPAWVPENAIIHIDLVGGSPQGRAWVVGVGIVAVDTLLGTDTNTQNRFGDTSYDSDDLTADGLAWVVAPPAIIGAALPAILNGTSVVKWKVVDEDTTRLFFPMAADGNDSVQIEAQQTGNFVVSSSDNGPLNLTVSGALNAAPGINAVAFTFTNDRLDLAVNGSSAVSMALDPLDRPPGNQLVAVAIFSDGQLVPIRSITIYDALPDTTGLSALSETA